MGQIMKKHALFTVAALALMSSCASTKEADPSAATQAPAATPAAASASGDHIFQYTITTEIPDAKDQIEILVAMNTLEGKYPAKYDLDCEGDGDFEYKGLTENQKCVYKKNSGNHQISVRGEIPAMFLCQRRPEPDMLELRPELKFVPEGGDDSSKAIISIDSWGKMPWKSMRMFAANCRALNKLPEGSPDLRQVKEMSLMFEHAQSFNQPLNQWDVSNITDMRGMFNGAESFNQPLDQWNTSNVTTMHEMFAGAQSFNQPIENWNTANVTDMSGLFFGAQSFNQPLNNWNTANVTDMSRMFMHATSFNQPLGMWDVSKVAYMFNMFSGAESFNQPLGQWNMSNVTHMDAMFAHATSFDQPVDQWDLSKVIDMNSMFKGAKAFSHYPKNWVVPAEKSAEMFVGTKAEAEAQKSPLKTK